ncbi:GNAT family N-acetyltransferase [Nocardioides sp.]|uniref:GNAT family N-acetyltransferase n=1 Tax=Nocardioides sp. TaxID=35761 RepID=UPI002733C62E|nr:GNAT family N-acetyltransferase [Nocardioides sp.]MDP3892434.1 GNAT family N-acetyltransferase [Nocardioides sp.]
MSLVVRPMRSDDIEEAERLSDTGYLELDRRTQQRDWPEPRPRGNGGSQRWRSRVGHLLATDPEGCWVAEVDGRLGGVAVAAVRDLTWILASLVVRPDLQGQRVGTALFEVARRHGRHCLRGMLNASADQRAVRTYRRAGFDLHPQMFLHGAVDRTALPVLDRVREGTDGDRELADSVARRLRDAAHGPDHDWLAGAHRMVVVDRPDRQGFAYSDGLGTPVLLAATHRRAAVELLWAVLAESAPDRDVTVDRVTGANQWALDVAVAAGLRVHQRGYLALHGLRPPGPYLPHGSLL